jgi:uncharacterized membrane protein SpoIIM required for sporulation
MRESTFIDRNLEKWKKMESSSTSDFDAVAEDYHEVLEDLAYARAHYPHSKIVGYLNHLANSKHQSIYRTSASQPFQQFWTEVLPSLLGTHKKTLWLATAFFLFFSVMGAICSKVEPQFLESVLGKSYIGMTQDNIQAGQPFGVYDREEQGMMFLRIFSNNLMVGLVVFASGLLLGLGSLYHTFRNALMVGSFFQMFFDAHLGWTALVIIGLHGTLELMGLVLHCTAGLVLGLNAFFPGNLTRAQAFKQGVQHSVRIWIGTLPITLLAAFIESYLTRLGAQGLSRETPVLSAALLMVFLLSWVFIIVYFYIYSNRIKKRWLA